MRYLSLLILLIPFTGTAQKQITLEDIYKNEVFKVETVPGFNSMNDGRYYVETTKRGIVKKSFERGETVDTIVFANTVKDEKDSLLSLNEISWSKDEKQLLIFKKKEMIYRHSSKAFVYVYNINTKKTVLIDKEKIMHATFSPDGTKVAFVKNNNLYYKDIAANKTIAVTTDGKKNNIINGSCDWVYEEEFSFTKAFEWSPDSKKLAYYRFDESKVKTFTMTVYDSLYPTPYTFKYPKAGEANSIIQIHIYHLANKKNTTVNIGSETDIYIPRIKWTADANLLAIAHLDRLQRHLKWMRANAETGATKAFYKESDDKYIERNYTMEFLNDNKTFIVLSERDGFNKIYLGNFLDDKLEKIETIYDVVELSGIDKINNIIYYSVAALSTDRQVYKYDIATKQGPRLTELSGTHKVTFNSDFTYFLDNYSTITTPPVYTLNKTSEANAFKTSERVLQNNSKLIAAAKTYNYNAASIFTIKNNSGLHLNAWMLKPANFDSTKKYPVLFCNYGGPGSQKVYNGWGAVLPWHQYLAQQGYIIVCVDNTGTGYKGAAFKKKTYGQLGKYEIEDQIFAAKYFGSLPYVDASRIGHWGWSYGGFMSSLAITKGAGIFKMAIAVAPVTNWRYYDNVYTELYMGLPQTNAKGYDDNSPVNFVDRIKGKFLIIHGTGDDNVHYQNSIMMVDEMIKKNIDFESAYYPNKNHGINGGNTSLHLYRKMTDFILKNL